MSARVWGNYLKYIKRGEIKKGEVGGQASSSGGSLKKLGMEPPHKLSSCDHFNFIKVFKISEVQFLSIN